ncbi:MAG: DNA recombination/repair protein RecA, partial [Aureliella sp.]
MAKKKSAAPASNKKGGKSPEGMEEVYKREPGLKTTLEQIEKQFGEGSIMPLGGEALLKIS